MKKGSNLYDVRGNEVASTLPKAGVVLELAWSIMVIRLFDIITQVKQTFLYNINASFE